MTELLRNWILGICGVSLITALALSVPMDGKVRRVARLVCGMAMIIALVRPALDFDYAAYSQYLQSYKLDLAEDAGAFDEVNERLTRSIIQEETAAYIWDKAEELGLPLSAVSVNSELAGDGGWYPYEAWLDAGGLISTALSDYMEAELGIPRVRQYWSGVDE